MVSKIVLNVKAT